MEYLKVLIVDDEPPAVENLCTMIDWEGHGFQVVATAGNGKKALELYDQFLPDIIMTDIRMPVMDGISLIDAIQKRSNRLVKFVLLTAYKEFGYVKEAMQLGVKDYLLKHEIHAESLVCVLDRFRQEILREREERMIVRRHEIRSFFNVAFSGVKSSEGSNIPPFDTKNLIALFVVQKDTSLLYPEQDLEVYDQESILTQIGGQYMGPLQFKEAAALSQRNWVLLFSPLHCYSRSVQKKELYAFSDKLLFALRTQTGCRFAVLIDQTRDYQNPNYEAFLPLYRCLRFLGSLGGSLLRRAIFSGDTLYQYLMNPVNKEKKKHLEGLLEKLSSAKRQADNQQVVLLLQELFELINQEPICDSFLNLTAKRIMELVGEVEVPEAWRSESIQECIQQKFLSSMQVSQKYGYSNTINRALQYLEEHYAEDIGVEEIAAQVNMTANHFSQRFKKEIGMTVLNYLTDIRMQKAKELLATGNYKVYEVAERVGYKTSQYFSKIFCRNVGMMPLEYKEKR